MSMVLFGNWQVIFFIPYQVGHFIREDIGILCIAARGTENYSANMQCRRQIIRTMKRFLLELERLS
uniref:Similar to PIE1 (PHOTOPERIOD-INDEPENDENT EARLY FLOWERING 1) n=1 Tax=Arundo donax TaxID=35708 RepID=A0A0A8YAF0_ARUDO